MLSPGTKGIQADPKPEFNICTRFYIECSISHNVGHLLFIHSDMFETLLKATKQNIEK